MIRVGPDLGVLVDCGGDEEGQQRHERKEAHDERFEDTGMRKRKGEDVPQNKP